MTGYRRAVVGAFSAGVALHALAVAVTWSSKGAFVRGGIVAWMDFPVSLAYLGLTGRSLLAASLSAGGLQWGVFAALLAYWLGSSVRNQRSG